MSSSPVTPMAEADCMGAAWPANIKLMYDLLIRRVEEMDDEHDQLSALSRLALTNAVTTSDMIAKQALRHTDVAVANQQVEQQTGATVSQDDIAKITQAVTTALTAVLGQIAVGRPVVDVPGATSASVKP